MNAKTIIAAMALILIITIANAETTVDQTSTRTTITEKQGKTSITINTKETIITPPNETTKLEFKKIMENKYKYNLVFTAQNKEEKFEYETQEGFIYDNGYQTAETTYDFTDMKRTGYEYEIKKKINGFTLIIKNLQIGKDYNIDPLLDSNYNGTTRPTNFHDNEWLSEGFTASYYGDVNFIQIDGAKYGTVLADWNLAIYNATSDLVPTTLVDSNCSKTLTEGTFIAWTGHGDVNFTFANKCRLTKGQKYAIVSKCIGCDANGYIWLSKDEEITGIKGLLSTNAGVDWNADMTTNCGHATICNYNYKLYLTNSSTTSLGQITSDKTSYATGQNTIITPTGIGTQDNEPIAFYCGETTNPTKETTICNEADQNYPYDYNATKCTITNTTIGYKTIHCRTNNKGTYSNEKDLNYTVGITKIRLHKETNTGTKIIGATIDINAGVGSYTTDTNGDITVNETKLSETTQEYLLEISKEGYIDKNYVFPLDKNGTTIDANLQTIDSNICFFKSTPAGTDYLSSTRWTVTPQNGGEIRSDTNTCFELLLTEYPKGLISINYVASQLGIWDQNQVIVIYNDGTTKQDMNIIKVDQWNTQNYVTTVKSEQGNPIIQKDKGNIGVKVTVYWGDYNRMDGNKVTPKIYTQQYTESGTGTVNLRLSDLGTFRIHTSATGYQDQNTIITTAIIANFGISITMKRTIETTLEQIQYFIYPKDGNITKTNQTIYAWTTNTTNTDEICYDLNGATTDSYCETDYKTKYTFQMTSTTQEYVLTISVNGTSARVYKFRYQTPRKIGDTITVTETNKEEITMIIATVIIFLGIILGYFTQFGLLTIIVLSILSATITNNFLPLAITGVLYIISGIIKPILSR